MDQSSEPENLKNAGDQKSINFHILTIFPEMFYSPFDQGIISKAIDNGRINIFLHDIRDKSVDKHGSVDDYPFGGGPGMLLKPEPIFNSIESIKKAHQINNNLSLIHI